MVDQHIFKQISQSKTADQVVSHIEELILEGVLRFGDRLPSERDLAQKLNISRPILRNAIKDLEDRKLLITKPGGGTHVADITGQVFSDAVIDLISKHEKATKDYLEYRRSIESIAAEMAAQRATKSDIEILNNLKNDMQLAHDKHDHARETALDIELHNTIGECAHNVILLHSLRSCYHLLSNGVIFNRAVIYSKAGAREILLGQHFEILDSIIDGDPIAAKLKAEQHIDFIISCFDEVTRENEREHVAQLRLRQRAG